MIPDFSILPSLITDAVALAVVGFSIGISLAKIFALKYGYSVDGNQVITHFLCVTPCLEANTGALR